MAIGSMRNKHEWLGRIFPIHSSRISNGYPSQAASIHFGEHHRLLSKRFPFAVYSPIESESVLVYAVLDCRRNPAWIRRRMGHDD